MLTAVPEDAADRAAAAAALVIAAAEAAHYCGLTATAGTDEQFTDATRLLAVAWQAACDGGRRDALTACAEVAARRGADPDRLPPPDPTAPPDAVAAGQLARELLATAAAELESGELTDLLPQAPWLMPVSVTGRIAAGYVCDSTVADNVKLTALALLAAPPAAGGQRPGPTRATGPRRQRRAQRGRLHP